MSEMARFCPVCDAEVDGPICPEDGSPTLSAEVLQKAQVDPVVGTVFSNRYRIDRILGDGGMGRVYVANQLSMHREVALKTLHQNLLNDRRYVGRFYQEAQSASALNSPHVVRIYDFGIDEESGTPFIAMELLKGEGLDEQLDRDGFLPVSRACTILSQVGKALIDAHAQGIIHRDLKPENIFMVQTADGEDFAKVMDFGIAKMLKGDSDSKLTATGTTLGTPLYMSPEQITGGQLSAQSDLYSLGCILHELLTGHPPFESEERLPILLMHVQDAPPPLPDVLPSGERCPPELRDLRDQMLAKKAENRPPSTADVVKELRRIGRRSAEYTPMGSVSTTGAGSSEELGVARTMVTASEPSLAVATAPDPDPEPITKPAEPVRRQQTAVTTDGDILGYEPKRKSWLPVALAAGLLVIGGGAFALLGGGDDGATASDAPAAKGTADPAGDTAAKEAAAKEAAAKEAAAKEAAAKEAAAKEAAAKEAAEKEAAAKEAAAKEAAKPVTVSFASEPQGATVHQDDKVLGTTPFSLEMPRDAGVLTLRFAAEGYQDSVIQVDPSREQQISRTLTAAPKPAAKPAARKPRPRATTTRTGKPERIQRGKKKSEQLLD